MTRKNIVAERRSNDNIRRIIEARIGCGRSQTKKMDLCQALGWCYNKLQARLENPDLFTRQELKQLCSTLEIPADDIRPYVI